MPNLIQQARCLALAEQALGRASNGAVALILVLAAIVSLAALLPGEPKWTIIPCAFGVPVFYAAQRWEVPGSLAAGNSWSLFTGYALVAAFEVAVLVWGF